MIERALVIGAGISGMQTALDIANSGYEVILVEKEPSIGGHMAQLSETFPTLDCSQCIMTPRMVEVGQHSNIRLLTLSEVTAVEGEVGNFDVQIARHPRYVSEEKCVACGACAKACPVTVPNEFDLGLSERAAIYIPSPQAVPPAVYRLDKEACLDCGKCAERCKIEAIDYDMQPETLEVKVGAIVVATGYELYTGDEVQTYGYGSHPDVLNGLEFERLLSASGPTGGQVLRPSDGQVPKEVVFIQCAGSRNPEHGMPYCSKICCMYTAKHAILYKHRVHDGQAYLFYIDVRAGIRHAGNGGRPLALHPGARLQGLSPERQTRGMGSRHIDRSKDRDRCRYGSSGGGDRAHGRKPPGGKDAEHRGGRVWLL